MTPPRPLTNARRRWRRTAVHERWLAGHLTRRSRRYRDAFATLETVCLFVGHGRSGHSLVAALLDAHPHALLADEIDSYHYLHAGFNRDQLFTLMAENSLRLAGKGRMKGRNSHRLYSYHVPDAWAGRWQRLRVIGEATNVTSALADNPWLLDRLRAVYRLPLRFVQVIRNPYDAIARLHLLTGRPLDDVAGHYFSVCRRTAVIRTALPAGDVHAVHHETLIAEPDATLTALCAFLALDAPADYRAACAAILFKKPNRVRHEVDWPAATLSRIAADITRYPFLSGYTYDN